MAASAGRKRKAIHSDPSTWAADLRAEKDLLELFRKRVGTLASDAPTLVVRDYIERIEAFLKDHGEKISSVYSLFRDAGLLSCDNFILAFTLRACKDEKVKRRHIPGKLREALLESKEGTTSRLCSIYTWVPQRPYSLDLLSLRNLRNESVLNGLEVSETAVIDRYVRMAKDLNFQTVMGALRAGQAKDDLTKAIEIITGLVEGEERDMIAQLRAQGKLTESGLMAPAPPPAAPNSVPLPAPSVPSTVTSAKPQDATGKVAGVNNSKPAGVGNGGKQRGGGRARGGGRGGRRGLWQGRPLVQQQRQQQHYAPAQQAIQPHYAHSRRSRSSSLHSSSNSGSHRGRSLVHASYAGERVTWHAHATIGTLTACQLAAIAMHRALPCVTAASSQDTLHVTRTCARRPRVGAVGSD
eukprot:jgi/Mesvir1/11097/Mv26094-RA.1